MAKPKLPSFEYTRVVYEDGTCSEWVNLAKPKNLMRWQEQNPDMPVPETMEAQLKFVHQSLNISDDFETWADSIEGLETREFESGKANA